MRKFRLEVTEPLLGKESSGRQLVDTETDIEQICPYAVEAPTCGNWCPKFDVIEYPGNSVMCKGVIMGEVVK